MSVKWWNDNKMWLAPIAALIMLVVSVLCFVFGLSFKNPTGYVLGGIDVSMWIAFSLSVANTIIQLIGNGKRPEDMDTVFVVGWGASYILGIASNVNALLSILGMGNVFLEWSVALSLGTMIEVMPEKLIVMWLKSLPDKRQPFAPSKPKQMNPNPYRPVVSKQPSKYHSVLPKQAHQNLPNPLRTNPIPLPTYLQEMAEMEEGEG